MSVARDRRKPGLSFVRASSRRIAAEIVVAYTVLVGIDRLLAGGQAFAGVTPHPYWLPILFAALLYGVGAGLAAAAAGSALWLLLARHEFAAGQDYFLHMLALTKLPLLWTIAALTIGEITSFRERRLVKTMRRHEKYRHQVDLLSRRYGRLNRINRSLQRRIVTDARSAGHVAEAIVRLTGKDSSTGIDDLVDLIALVAGTGAFILYGDDGTRLVPLAPAPDGATPPAPGLALVARLRAGGEAVDVGDSAGRALLDGSGVIAIPLRHGRDGPFAGALVIHALPAERLTAAAIAELAAIPRWLNDLFAARIPWRAAA